MEGKLNARLEKLLAVAKEHTEDAEVFYSSAIDTPVIFEANRLKQLQTNESTLVALRIVRDGRIGLSTDTKLTDMDSLVGRAVEVSQFGTPAKFEFPGERVYPETMIYDPEVSKYGIEHMVSLGEAMISKVREHTPDLQCDASLDMGTATVRILNSRGGEISYQKSFYGIALEGNLIRGTDMLFVGDSESSCHPITETEAVVNSVVRQLNLSERQATVTTGRMPVLFTAHGVVSAFVAPLSVAFNGRTVLQGVSPLVNRLGEKVFSHRLSLWDDATIPYRPRSRPCDDEGTESRRIPLVDQGKVSSFLYDLQTAGLAGVESTGSGDRGGGLPSPSISSLVFATGDAGFEEMLREMREGLVVEQLMGASQTNVLGGDFSGNVLLGYRVEKGEIVGRVKDTVVSGNIYQSLHQDITFGREGKWVGAVFAPDILCPELIVGSKKG